MSGDNSVSNTALAVMAFIVYCAIAACLCMAAITDPDIKDSDQWLWCAAAIAWGPIFAAIFAAFDD